MFYGTTRSKEEIVRLLENQSYQLQHAADGVAAIEAAKRRRKVACWLCAAVGLIMMIAAVALVQ